MTGWTKKPRGRFEHPLFEREKFCRGYAWDWLCDHAAFKAMEVSPNGRTVKLERGQLCYSIRYLAKAWNWDKAAVDRFLRRLKSETLIDTRTETGQTIITICDYEYFSGEKETGETPTETPTETAARQQRDSSETNKKEGKQNDNISPLTPHRGEDDLFSEPKSNATSSRGTRLPEDWTLSTSLGEWAVEEGMPPAEVRREAEKFKDYWLATPGAKGRKADWSRTFKNWIRTALERRQVKPYGGGSRPGGVSGILAEVQRRDAQGGRR